MEKTFLICKPDAMQKRLVGTVISRFEAAGFDVIACKMARLSPALLREHYAHVASKPFYPDIERFMSSRPVVMIALFLIGLIVIFLHYVDLFLPGAASNWWLLGGLGFILSGIIAATQYR